MVRISLSRIVYLMFISVLFLFLAISLSCNQLAILRDNSQQEKTTANLPQEKVMSQDIREKIRLPSGGLDVIRQIRDLYQLHVVNSSTANSAGAILGETIATTGNTHGVVGMHKDSGNYGALGNAIVGVYGENAAQGKTWGSLGGNPYAVEGGNDYSKNHGAIAGLSTGVEGWAYNYQNNIYSAGVAGHYEGGNYGALGTPKYGVFGAGLPYAGYFDGKVHADTLEVTGADTYVAEFKGKIRAEGLDVSGAKHFVVPDPTDPTKEISYASLEGPEAGTYIRGSAQVVNGKTTIQIPDHFAKVTSEQGVTVQLTPIGKWLQLYVLEKNTSYIVVADSTGQTGNFDYLIQGIRKGYENYRVEGERTINPVQE